MRLCETCIGLLAISPALVASSFAPYRPLTASSGSNSNSITVNESTVFKLSFYGRVPDIVFLDYGKDIEGYATFKVTNTSGDTSVFEMSYSETRALLNNYMVSIISMPIRMETKHVEKWIMTKYIDCLSSRQADDGPLPLSAAMDTYRINRFNITELNTYTRRLI
jgi:hypothetical protein